MVKIDEALETIYQQITKKRVEIIPLQESINRVIAREYRAKLNLPSFDNSADLCRRCSRVYFVG
ncbi:MAG: hypothetical protein IE878_06230 [Epsilonproteobacteria bacterium]|nr:hypothetical protein [Campylobacterota bacterium]